MVWWFGLGVVRAVVCGLGLVVWCWWDWAFGFGFAALGIGLGLWRDGWLAVSFGWLWHLLDVVGWLFGYGLAGCLGLGEIGLLFVVG